MARVIDTRGADGRGLKYTAYDTKLVDYAKAPTTGIDPDKRFKIGKPKTLDRPGNVEYFGDEFRKEAEDLAKTFPLLHKLFRRRRSRLCLFCDV